MSPERRLIIAIDGPAGAGKSTVARAVAEALGYAYIDSGAMYRAVAWLAREAGVSFDDPDALARLARSCEMRFEGHGKDQVLLADGRPLRDELRTPEMSHLSSVVSQVGGVREALVAQQRRMGEEGGVVMEGRDIGTVVFPHADLKVYLTASDETRARRRAEELRRKGLDASDAATLEEVRRRDQRDADRQHSPMRPADDAVHLPTDGLSVPQVVRRILDLCRERT